MKVSYFELGWKYMNLDWLNLRDAANYTKEASEAGYNRTWFAANYEPQYSIACPDLMIASVSTYIGRTTMRYGAGGVLMNHHDPFDVLQRYTTLSALNDGNIDVAFGSVILKDFPFEQVTDRFIDRVDQYRHFQAAQFATLKAPAPEMWMLGRTAGYAAEYAGKIGVPFASSMHFDERARREGKEAVRAYIENYQHEGTQPYAMLGGLCLVNEDLNGVRKELVNWQSLVNPKNTTLQNERHADYMMDKIWCGDPQTVREKIRADMKETGAHEVLLVHLGDYYFRIYSIRAMRPELW